MKITFPKIIQFALLMFLWTHWTCPRWDSGKLRRLTQDGGPIILASAQALYLRLLESDQQHSSTEKECHRNLEVLWLMKQLAPDFRTIADVRKENDSAVNKVCCQFIIFCKQAGLVVGGN
ncbi:MAG TPA: hypothetical protein DCX68_01940 [Marinobacter hydrocarbonoclasticus]|nr:hypothetical protein [Marinobacter nauticus]